jgi:hypothetical protein
MSVITVLTFFFLLSFGGSLKVGYFYARDSSRFINKIVYNMETKKNTACNVSIAAIAITAPRHLAIQSLLAIVHYFAFAVWTVEYLLILWREAFVDSLRVPWQP